MYVDCWKCWPALLAPNTVVLGLRVTGLRWWLDRHQDRVC